MATEKKEHLRQDIGYNQRLFSRGLRKYFHTSRFRWLSLMLARLNVTYDSVIELGCFDGKILEFLPKMPSRYFGLDANWEGGLDIARQRWERPPNMTFAECHAPEQMTLNGERFDIAICQDTLEHVPPEMVEPYIKRLAEATRSYVFITAPNEKGIVCVLKYSIKRIAGQTEYTYTPRELANALFGRMQKIERHEHKGFDYDAIIRVIAKYFDLVAISGYPFSRLPLALNFGVGIVGKARGG